MHTRHGPLPPTSLPPAAQPGPGAGPCTPAPTVYASTSIKPSQPTSLPPAAQPGPGAGPCTPLPPPKLVQAGTTSTLRKPSPPASLPPAAQPGPVGKHRLPPPGHLGLYLLSAPLPTSQPPTAQPGPEARHCDPALTLKASICRIHLYLVSALLTHLSASCSSAWAWGWPLCACHSAKLRFSMSSTYKQSIQAINTRVLANQGTKEGRHSYVHW